jgi:hypothetical protein
VTGPVSLQLGKDQGDSRLSYRRRQILSSAGLARPRIALEVGAFDNPTVRARDGFDVRYADYFSAAELREMHAANPRRDPARIVEVDYVIKGPRLSPFIREEVDLLVANHVVEHLPDPIGWLRDVERFCSASAAIFLAVPDQRYTFDYLKRPSDAIELVAAHEQGKAAPDPYDIARMRWLHTRVDAAALWQGADPPVPPLPAPRRLRELLEQSRAQAAQGYTDVHCTFYTSDSFVRIFDELHRSGYIAWEVEHLQDVDPGGNEFCVLLRRASAAP